MKLALIITTAASFGVGVAPSETKRPLVSLVNLVDFRST